MTVHIPMKKSDVLRDYHGRGDNRERPALNVKYYGPYEYTAERIMKECGCTKATAERVAEWCYEAAQEDFWERALDSLNFAMLGDERASQYKPVGLKDGPYKVWAEGRSGGWLVVEGLPEVSTWDGPQFMKWRKFARYIKQEMEHLASWEWAKGMIEANDWAPKADSGDAIRADARAKSTGKLAEVALKIHEELDGKEWDDDNIDRIAGYLRDAGLPVREPQEV